MDETKDVEFAVSTLHRKIQNMSLDIHLFDSKLKKLSDSIDVLNNEISELKIQSEKRKGWFW